MRLTELGGALRLRNRAHSGVRFRIFTQTGVLSGFEEPETIALPARRGEIMPGPSDQRFYTITPAAPKAPYDPPHSFPPYSGPVLAPALPDRAGHFDHIPVDAPEFPAAHTFAVSRLTLQTWERALGREIPWSFHFERMELVTSVEWTNAHSGYGFIELGHSSRREDGMLVPFWMNFDVVAHELGHAILFSLMPLSPGVEPDREYRTFHETGSDLIAFVTAMQSERLLDHVLRQSGGDIYGLNELNRLGEVSDHEHIRELSNDLKVADVRDAEKIHTYSLTLTGALFDVFALRYIRALETLGLVPQAIADRVLWSDWPQEPDHTLSDVMQSAYDAHPDLCAVALRHARDEFATLFAQTLVRLPADKMSFLATANTVLRVHSWLFSARDEEEISRIFLRRGIGSHYVH